MKYFGSIDQISFGDGFIVVSGWLAAPKMEAWPSDIFIRCGEQIINISHWFSRKDLPNSADDRVYMAFLQDSVCEFDKLSSKEITLEVKGAEQGIVTRNISNAVPFLCSGHIDAASQLGIAGWVFDPSIWFGKSSVSICINDEHYIPVSLNSIRQDIQSSATLRGDKLGFFMPAAELGEALIPFLPFQDGKSSRLTLHSGGIEIASRDMDLSPLSLGRFEEFRDGQVWGWAAFKDAPKTMASVQIAIDGIPFATVRANRGRRDLQTKGLAIDCGGFVMPLSLSPNGSDKIEVQARVAGEIRWIAGSGQQVAGLGVARGIQAAPWHMLSIARPKVSIIIPVYNAPDDLDLCLKSVIAHTGGEARLIVIDDASPDPRVTQTLAPYQNQNNITILVNEQNLGFTRTCNRGIDIAGRDDIILLNSDTIVPERWIENLVVAAYSSPTAASATPLSDNAGAFSAPELGGSNRIPSGLSDNDMSRLVAQVSLATYPQVPTGHGYCLYFRRDALDVIGSLDAAAFPRGYGEENDLCMRALRAGFHHVVDDRTYVRHRQSASFGASKTELLAEGRAALDERYPEYKRLVQVFSKDERMLGMRWRVRRAFLAGVRPRPRVLFVISTDSGGTPLTNLDLMRTLEDRYEPWLMRCNGQQIILQRVIEGELKPVSQRALDGPLVMSVHRSAEYNDIVAEMLLAHAIELMHVRHLAWHGLDLPRIGKALGIPVVLSLHDFYTICPTIKLLDGEMRHCAGRCTIGEGDCRAELWPADQVPQLRNRFVYRWREMMAIAINACDAFVTTSVHARHLLTDAFPQMKASDFRVIEHGRSFDAFLPTGTPPQAGSPARILVPGNISFAKGAELIRAMAMLDGGQRVEFHILGDHGALQTMPGLILHGRYTRDAFLRRVSEIAPHLGAVFSIWPETYCHTLTELWASGLPVFALDTGAVGERIHAHGAGWLTTSQDPAELLEIIIAAVTDETDFQEKLVQVRDWQEGYGTKRDLHAMADDYAALYCDIMERRLTFKAASDISKLAQSTTKKSKTKNKKINLM